MNIFNQLKIDVIKSCEPICGNQKLLELSSVEIPKNTLNGDLSSNVAMLIAAHQKISPREVAMRIRESLISIPYISSIEIANPGFINVTIKPEIWQSTIHDILHNDPDFFHINIGQGTRVNVEYVSANPTGPMHIGHARGAIYGDVLAEVLNKTGYQVTKEYYVNDAGGQIDDLARAVLLRYKQALGEPIQMPAGLYPGEYLIDTGKKLAKKFGSTLLTMSEKGRHDIIKNFAVQEMLAINKQDLKELGIEHNVFFSEKSLHDDDKINQVVQSLTNAGLIYTGQLPPPKGKQDEEWSARAQQLFKSTLFGDDQDRAVKKSDGSWSYFAADLAYAKDKIDRNFDHLILVLGADHGGYVKRIEAIVKALANDKVAVDVKICQLVNFMVDNVPIKMSKRSGNFTSVRDVIDQVGKDSIRFMMLTRRNDAPLDFDLQKVKEQSRDNPVFYVQYAYVRTLSILEKAKATFHEAYNEFLSNNYDLTLLASEEEIEMIKLLARWPKTLESAAKYFEPHRIAFFVINIASHFHTLWNFGKENNDYRFIIKDNLELTVARLALAKAIQSIIATSLEVMGVTPIKKM